MNPLEPAQAFFGYGFLLFFPGFLWTFLNRSMSSKLGIVERIVHTAGISISFLSLALLLANVWLEIRLGFFTVVIFAILIGCMPLVIGLLWDIIHKRGLGRPEKMIKDSLDYLRTLIHAVKNLNVAKRNVILLGILVMGIGFTLLPHVGYPLPIHTDEWHYMAYSNSLIENGDVMLENPYSGTGGVSHWEIGFIVFISSFKMVSGVSWPFLFYTLPAVIFALCILTAYVIGRRFGWGLHSAFLVALLPSTLRFLGPVFLVPVTLALFLLPWGIFLVLGHEKRSRYAFLAILAVFVFLMHPASGIYLFLALLAIWVVYLIKKEWRESAMLGCLLLAFIVFALYMPKTTLYNVNISTLTTSGRFFLPAFEIADFLSYIGYVPVLLLAIGLGVQFRKRETRNLGLISTIIILFLFIATLYCVYPRFYNVQAVYDRAIMHLAVLISIVAGSGLFLVQKRSKTIFIVVLASILLISINAHVDEQYYHIIDENEYEDFVWIRDNLNSTYDKAILDPWKAIAFPPVTGKSVYYRIPQGPDGTMGVMTNNIGEFFAGGCMDTAFLESNGISIVYTRGLCSNPDLYEVRSGVYILDYSG